MVFCDHDTGGNARHDHRLVANAGLILPFTLAHHLGLGKLAEDRLYGCHE